MIDRQLAVEATQAGENTFTHQEHFVSCAFFAHDEEEHTQQCADTNMASMNTAVLVDSSGVAVRVSQTAELRSPLRRTLT